MDLNFIMVMFSNFFCELFSAEGYDEVLNIQEMYREVISSFINLKREEELDTLAEEDVKFPGFDGNNETKQMSYVDYFAKDFG